MTTIQDHGRSRGMVTSLNSHLHDKLYFKKEVNIVDSINQKFD
jgi:hypothetical protein